MAGKQVNTNRPVQIRLIKSQNQDHVSLLEYNSSYYFIWQKAKIATD